MDDNGLRKLTRVCTSEKISDYNIGNGFVKNIRYVFTPERIDTVKNATKRYVL